MNNLDKSIFKLKRLFDNNLISKYDLFYQFVFKAMEVGSKPLFESIPADLIDEFRLWLAQLSPSAMATRLNGEIVSEREKDVILELGELAGKERI